MILYNSFERIRKNQSSIENPRFMALKPSAILNFLPTKNNEGKNEG